MKRGTIGVMSPDKPEMNLQFSAFSGEKKCSLCSHKRRSFVRMTAEGKDRYHLICASCVSAMSRAFAEGS